jgi:hypothetical protein
MTTTGVTSRPPQTLGAGGCKRRNFSAIMVLPLLVEPVAYCPISG